MSNKLRLQANNTNLQALINKANALPDAGSGGGSVETCTVIINHPYRRGYDYIASHMATTYTDNKYFYDLSNKWYNFNTLTTSQHTINNVISNTYVYIQSIIDSGVRGYTFENAELAVYEAGGFILKITARAGETAVINIWDDD